ncbi:MAG: hypothetical protein EOP00_26135 [Pedobacter sp.]|nr:MAG: hypothetical protein EOP00_26135 [Pedobacter sp.]
MGFTIKDEIIYKSTELDLSSVDLVIILIGESTRFLGNHFKAAVTEILNTDIPVLCLNTNGFIGLEEDFCPIMLADAGCIHMPFNRKDLELSLGYIKNDERAEQKTGSFHYKHYTPDPFSE